jgi:hypothetical protein
MLLSGMALADSAKQTKPASCSSCYHRYKNTYAFLASEPNKSHHRTFGALLLPGFLRHGIDRLLFARANAQAHSLSNLCA